MRKAYIHDRIINIWWAEQVFKDIISKNIEKWDINEIFTIFSDKEFLEVNWQKIKINTVISNNFLIEKIDYRNFMPLFPLLTRLLSKKLKKFKPDKTIISSFAIWKNISIPFTNKITYLYLHSPMQYIWDMYDENIKKLIFFKKIPYMICTRYLRIWDKKFINFDTIEYNSRFTQKLAKEIYWMKKWSVIYPQIDNKFIKQPISSESLDYFIFIWRLVKFSKQVDIIIKLFNQTGDNLLILWDWPDEIYLKSIAQWNIKFLWHISDIDQKIKITKKARGLINLTKESFGKVTAEALCLWVPVFGINWGATPELIWKNMWLLVDDLNINNLVIQFNKFKQTQFNKKEIKEAFIKKYGG